MASKEHAGLRQDIACSCWQGRMTSVCAACCLIAAAVLCCHVLHCAALGCLQLHRLCMHVGRQACSSRKCCPGYSMVGCLVLIKCCCQLAQLQPWSLQVGCVCLAAQSQGLGDVRGLHQLCRMLLSCSCNLLGLSGLPSCSCNLVGLSLCKRPVGHRQTWWV